jgi:putative SOS response-associated peptidase YedK
MADFHNRMPPILRSEDFAAWLDPANDKVLLKKFLKPFAGILEAVSAESGKGFKTVKMEYHHRLHLFLKKQLYLFLVSRL